MVKRKRERGGRERGGRERGGRERGGRERLEIYDTKFQKEIDTVIKDIEKENMKFNKPNNVELAKIEKIIKEYIAKRGLKLYGGHALNRFMPVADKIYEDGIGINDYDLYCVDAAKEGQELADLLYKKGIEYVSLSVGGFGDNYKLFCSFEEIANFTGLPQKLFDVIPVKKDGRDGILYVEPDYLKMDLRVSLVNPRISLWRWVKDYKRKELLSRYHPFVKPMNCKWIELSAEDKKDMIELSGLVGDLVKGRGGKAGSKGGGIDVVYTGFNSLYMFFKEGRIENSKGSLDEPKQIMTEIMTEQIKDVIDAVMKKYGNKGFLYAVEEDPLHILPKRFVVRGKKSARPLLIVYSLGENCVPYVIIRGVKCVSVDYLMLYFQVSVYHSMMNGVVDYEKLWRCSLFGLNEMRDEYLKHNELTVFDESIYRMYIIRCFGNFVNPYYKTKLLKWEKKMGGTYIPAMADANK